MGKLISLMVIRARREGRFVTEEDAARRRGLTEWYRNRFNPQWAADLGKPSKPPVPPGSKVQLKVVWRRPSWGASSVRRLCLRRGYRSDRRAQRPWPFLTVFH
jgi:hypothetical protein